MTDFAPRRGFIDKVIVSTAFRLSWCTGLALPMTALFSVFYHTVVSHRNRYGVLLCACLLGFAGLILTNHAYANDANDAGEHEEGIPYVVVFKGQSNKEMETLLRSVSQCEELRTTPPASRFVLVRRTKKDEKRLTKALHSKGYFAAKVTSSINFDRPAPEVAQITFHLVPSHLYRLDKVVIHVAPEGKDALAIPTPTSLQLVKGEDAVARKIFTAEKLLLEEATKQGFAFAKLGKRFTQVDHDKHTMDVDLVIDTGNKIVLGAATLSGVDRVDMNYLMARIPWKPGILYHPALFKEARSMLLSTGLFNIARIKIEPDSNEAGHHPVSINLVQRKHRSIRSGLGYGTGTGFKLSASWEHRNIFSAGEKIEVKGHAATQTLNFESSFSKPDFLRMQQKLLVSAKLDQEENKAFDKNSFGLEAGLTRTPKPNLTFSYGLGYRVVKLEDKSIRHEESFGLFSTPVLLVLDKRDNLLDPSKGWYLNLAATGMVDTLGTGIWFGKVSGQYRHYHKILDKPRLILAGRLGLGAILGPSQNDIPADERFFVGGGGSLRGYGFQMATEVGPDQEPIGGRSMLDFSLEARVQVTESIGMVTFVDGGRAFAKTVPQFGKEVYLGPGVGIRYKTPIGPLRFDVAVPWNPREEIDSSYQLYVSIGQAF